jgi:hypothetical protein
MRLVILGLLVAGLAACQNTGSGSAQSGQQPGLPAVSAPPIRAFDAPLAHEGGIVYLTPLTAIHDGPRQQAAALLGAELLAALRAERAMSDAARLATVGNPSSAFWLAATGSGQATPGPAASSPDLSPSPSPTPRTSNPSPDATLEPGSPPPDTSLQEHPAPSPTPSRPFTAASASSGAAGATAPWYEQPAFEPASPHPVSSAGGLSSPPSASPGRDPQSSTGSPNAVQVKDAAPLREAVHAAEKQQEAEALTAWSGLTPTEQHQAQTNGLERARIVDAAWAPQLARKSALFTRDGNDATAHQPDGSTTTTRKFQLRGLRGHESITVQRTFDPQGSFVQCVVTLVGQVDQVEFDCESARTIKPDGSEASTSDLAFTLEGRPYALHWAKSLSASGLPSGTGEIVRGNGERVSLLCGGISAWQETISGRDEVGGVSAVVRTDDTASTATATLDAGPFGRAILQLGIDENLDNTSAAQH